MSGLYTWGVYYNNVSLWALISAVKYYKTIRYACMAYKTSPPEGAGIVLSCRRSTMSTASFYVKINFYFEIYPETNCFLYHLFQLNLIMSLNCEKAYICASIATSDYLSHATYACANTELSTSTFLYSN